MTKGNALIQAREILGATGHVRYDPSLPYPCKVGTFAARWEGVAVGRDWHEALRNAREER